LSVAVADVVAVAQDAERLVRLVERDVPVAILQDVVPAGNVPVLDEDTAGCPRRIARTAGDLKIADTPQSPRQSRRW
jgi:hypothetical protein